eukprot:2135081-Prymnesium_polylepis.1
MEQKGFEEAKRRAPPHPIPASRNSSPGSLLSCVAWRHAAAHLVDEALLSLVDVGLVNHISPIAEHLQDGPADAVHAVRHAAPAIAERRSHVRQKR